MKCKFKHMVGVALLAALSCACTQKTTYFPNISTTASLKGTSTFQPDSASIAENYKIPDWFTDAKFGIFIHWGVYTVPAYGSEWYARWMYQKGSKINKYHEKTYGKLTEFGYKDFIPKFKAENFNPKEWAELFKEAGAKYVVPVAEHHDGFSMYNSSFNKWNSVKMGPKIDVIGELKEAITALGLHFGLSSHRCENAWFYEYGMDTPSDVQDTSISLYGSRVHKPEGEGMTPEYGKYEGSDERSRKEWLMHTYELIDKYQPELIWFDWTVGKYPFQDTFYKFMAYYYNNALDWHKDVVVNTKFGYGDNIQVFDIERGKSDRIRKYPWQTDTSIGKKSWSYCMGEINKSPDHIIDDFADIVSKNGNLLLNVGPKLDGTITKEQQHVLREIGKWLKVNGEAIYYSRPWVIAEEGSTKGTSGYMTDNTKTEYTAQDIRFTTRDNNLYAISLAWTDGEVLIKSLATSNGINRKVTNVEMLGSDEAISWSQTKNGLKVHFPKNKPTEYAHVFKITLSGTDLSKPIIDYDKNGFNAMVTLMNHSDAAQKVTLSSRTSKDNQEQVVTIDPKSKRTVSFHHELKANKKVPYKFYVNNHLYYEKL